MISSEEQGHEDWTGRLSPTDVHHVVFSRVGLGRRGYDEIEVDVFLERVEQELSRLIAERADLRDEVTRLRAQAASRSAAAPVQAAAPTMPAVAPTMSSGAPTDGALTLQEAQRQAVRLLAAAQQTADAYVADAETYSRRLTLDARERSERMVAEAREAARRMVQDAGAHQGTQVRPEHQAAYLEQFGQVVRVQLRSYLEALLRDVDQEWDQTAHAVPVASPVITDEARQGRQLVPAAPVQGEASGASAGRGMKDVMSVVPVVQASGPQQVEDRSSAGIEATGDDRAEVPEVAAVEVPAVEVPAVEVSSVPAVEVSSVPAVQDVTAADAAGDRSAAPDVPPVGAAGDAAETLEERLQQVPPPSSQPAEARGGEASEGEADGGSRSRKRKTVKMHTR